MENERFLENELLIDLLAKGLLSKDEIRLVFNFLTGGSYQSNELKEESEKFIKLITLKHLELLTKGTYEK